MDTVVLIPTKVVRVEERSGQVYVSGIGKDAVFESVSKGWFVLFDGSWEALYVGAEKPSWAQGDEMEVIIRKKANAKPI